MFSTYRFKLLFFFLSTAIVYMMALYLSFHSPNTHTTKEYTVVTMGISGSKFELLPVASSPKESANITNIIAKKPLKPIKPTRRDSVLIPVDVVRANTSMNGLVHRADVPLHAVLILNIPQE